MPHETAVPVSPAPTASTGPSAGLSASGPVAGAYDLVVVGGGVAGLSTAWRAARRGLRVAVADPAPASGASHAAAGMLAPVSEVTYTEEPLLRLGLASLARWPDFAAELAADSGLGADVLDYRTDGTLEVAFGSDDLAALDELAAFMGVLGLPVERLTGRECRRLEPMLAPAVRGGLLAREDAWVDPRRVTAALLAALERRGVPVVRARAVALERSGGTVTGVRLAPGTGSGAGPGGEGGEGGDAARGGRVLRGDRVVLATGAWSGTALEGLPAEALPPVRPVKGQIMRLRSTEPVLSRCVRGAVHGARVYLVPRGDGELVLGATQEELGFDTRVTAGGLWELLRDARELVPGVTELEVADVTAGLRPGTPDNLPLVGSSALPGLLMATGHHRGGVLLAPLTADLLLEESGDPEGLAALCSPLRFQEHRSQEQS
ncbi:glycine oxidase ThiO [Planomonospora parontospora subsp. parontospora]|uniref:Glycine oxidase ThiO n=2 Tax=Planomonospora parontospora TaxID=58119 RepID=A0AA37F2B0_9ACTN|nr:FAD-dependent oxidoreductase [Planomonospora parontospora]GGK47168.1 glycine oxidase ThiO [Planomonospora parontospora]GII06568.1 glycine oxidase ThiO [Planomonospora parontospora subsp. parontospora]